MQIKSKKIPSIHFVALITVCLFILSQPALGQSLGLIGSKEKPNISYLMNDIGYQHQWYLHDSSAYGIQFEKAYKEFFNYPKNEVIVAVIDTGFDINHVDLKKNLWINSKEIANNQIDDDDNGYIDDVSGINTLDRDQSGKATNNVSDLGYHGTHEFGLIAAEQNNQIGIVGIASKVKVMPIKTLSMSKDEDEKDVAEALLYAARNGAKVINCSFGKKKFYDLNILRSALAEVERNYDVLIVVAAGNGYGENLDKDPNYPAAFSFEKLLTVASHDSLGGLSEFSNFGLRSVHLSAPGNGMYSAVANDSYEMHQGTSMAAPVVTAIAAEIRSLFPILTAKQVKDILLQTTDPLESMKNKTVTGGRVNMYSAIKMAERVTQMGKW